MEYCSGGDLFSYIEKRNFKLPEKKACEIIFKLCRALYYIHSYGIVHRDLKPENILMTDDTENADIRLLDFGLSKILGPDEMCNEPYGTLSYCAPEVITGKPYNKQVDLFSVGVITYLLLSGQLPFNHKNSETEIARLTIEEQPSFKSKDWKKVSNEAIEFINGLLNKDPVKRFTIKDAIQHKWFKKFFKKEEVTPNKSSTFEMYSSPVHRMEGKV
jgi:serine/threonine protein kinase